jgi:hypothetical protein
MAIKIGDGVTYRAELFRVKGNRYARLEKEGHGYIVDKAGKDLFYVFNGVRHALVAREDITIQHKYDDV